MRPVISRGTQCLVTTDCRLSRGSQSAHKKASLSRRAFAGVVVAWLALSQAITVVSARPSFHPSICVQVDRQQALQHQSPPYRSASCSPYCPQAACPTGGHSSLSMRLHMSSLCTPDHLWCVQLICSRAARLPAPHARHGQAGRSTPAALAPVLPGPGAEHPKRRGGCCCCWQARHERGPAPRQHSQAPCSWPLSPRCPPSCGGPSCGAWASYAALWPSSPCWEQV